MPTEEDLIARFVFVQKEIKTNTAHRHAMSAQLRQALRDQTDAMRRINQSRCSRNKTINIISQFHGEQDGLKQFMSEECLQEAIRQIHEKGLTIEKVQVKEPE